MQSHVAHCSVWLQSLEEVQGVLQQEMQGLKAERSKFKDLLHDAKSTAAQAAGPDQTSVSTLPPHTQLLRAGSASGRALFRPIDTDLC